MTGIAVSSILTPSMEEKMEQVQLVKEVDRMIASAQFSDSELEWLDQLSQRFPQAANPFQKMVALEKIGGRLTETEREALFNRYTARLTENEEQAKALLLYVERANLKGNDQHPIKALAIRVKQSALQ